MGDVLRIDLTTRTTSEESLPRELTEELVGGKGIGTDYLSRRSGPTSSPSSPQNKLIFVVGPMGGTTMFGSNRYAVYFVSPLTGGYCECYSGGNVTPQFAKTGYKVVIVEGRAERPVYLEVWEPAPPSGRRTTSGVSTPIEAEERLSSAAVRRKRRRASSAPPARSSCAFACIENNKWHSVARGGPGAVFGSKNVKGLVFHGEREGRGRPPRRVQGARQGHGRAGQGRSRRRRSTARRHGEHGPHHERRQRLPHPVLDERAARRLRAPDRRDHARGVRAPPTRSARRASCAA